MSYTELSSMQALFDHLASAGDQLVVVCFHLSYCPACRGAAPIFRNLAAKNPERVYLRCEVEDVKEAIERFDLQAVPTFIAFLWQEEIKKYVGAKEAPLEKFFELSGKEWKDRLARRKQEQEAAGQNKELTTTAPQATPAAAEDNAGKN